MLELREIANILSGVSVRETKGGTARFMRLADLSDIKAGRSAPLVLGDPPAVARALTIEEGDLIVGARGVTTDVCVAAGSLLGAFISLDLYLVRPNQAFVNPQYLAAFLDLPTTQATLSGGKQGTGLARLAKEALEKIEIPLPPLEQQQLIAGLAQSFELEARLLKQLAELNAILGREAVTRAIRAADTGHNY
ncbi:restriction endonuclease subunit S [Shinella sp. JR1-6]|uniref:restriction endonuclease subunit S n=1 Tax=Shinella sp. JR1-6 TaxID=2527671 RepID=UPI00102D3B83|nr:restriction endonuclease subunit S [Shinella sp. JR1-6]TAA65098.1 hypothetical protein EXZ48_02660 [Shinella sp. JR1-6]